jgi:UPF0755 protein
MLNNPFRGKYKVAAITTVLVLMGLLLRGWVFYRHLYGPLHLDGPYVLEVASGSNLSRVLRQLDREEIMTSPGDLMIVARFHGLADQLKAGEYLLQDGLTGLQLLQKLASGQVIYHQARLGEGQTLREALEVIQSHEAITAVLDPADPEGITRAFGLTYYPEGLFFPDTYNFVRGSTDRDMLERARQLMDQVLDEAWQGRDAGLPYASPYEALIMASIIEKETALASEREQIAGVFVRRLQRNMRLQTDPTVIYGLGDKFDGNLTRADLQADTPWNTYTRTGLPVTPIALPGRASIEASLHPDQADTLYFVARGDGSHYFSTTLEEHNRAVRQYQLGEQESQ